MNISTDQHNLLTRSAGPFWGCRFASCSQHASLRGSLSVAPDWWVPVGVNCYSWLKCKMVDKNDRPLNKWEFQRNHHSLCPGNLYERHWTWSNLRLCNENFAFFCPNREVIKRVLHCLWTKSRSVNTGSLRCLLLKSPLPNFSQLFPNWKEPKLPFKTLSLKMKGTKNFPSIYLQLSTPQTKIHKK